MRIKKNQGDYTVAEILGASTRDRKRGDPTVDGKRSSCEPGVRATPVSWHVQAREPPARTPSHLPGRGGGPAVGRRAYLVQRDAQELTERAQAGGARGAARGAGRRRRCHRASSGSRPPRSACRASAVGRQGRGRRATGRGRGRAQAPSSRRSLAGRAAAGRREVRPGAGPPSLRSREPSARRPGRTALRLLQGPGRGLRAPTASAGCAPHPLARRAPCTSGPSACPRGPSARPWGPGGRVILPVAAGQRAHPGSLCVSPGNAVPCVLSCVPPANTVGC